MKKETLDELISKVDDIFGTLNCIKIVSDVEKFQKWLKEEHKITNPSSLFRGYQFFLESAIRTFLNSIILDSALDIEEDFVFHRARFNGVEISKVPNTCEKTILVRNINEKLRDIKRSRNYEEMKEAIKKFNTDVVAAFDKIYTDHVVVSPELNIRKEEALRYATMSYTFIFLNDTSYGYPHGYFVSLLSSKMSSEQYRKSFEGYKYALQFVWYSLLGENYYSTSIKNLHNAEDWSAKDDFGEISLEDSSEDPKETKERKDLDSYFGKIQEEIIVPLEKKLNLDLGFGKLLYLKKKPSKSILKKLLTPLKEPKLNEREKLDYQLLWYPVELMDSSKSHIFNGVPAFITLLAGSVELKRIFAEGEKAYVCKFVHPRNNLKDHDFSYGVLIEASGNIGISDYSGWMLSFDCCGDYSGFSGSQHAMAETFIEEYKKQGLIDVKKMTIGKDDFKKYIADKMVAEKRELILEELEEISKKRLERDIVGEAKGLILELITYYTLSKRQYDWVDWNVTINQNQLDIILESGEDFILIECKTKPGELGKEITKLKEKLERYPTNKKKKCEFWYWNRPAQKIINKLHDEGIGVKIVSELVENDPLWRNKKLDKLKNIFNRNI